MTLRTLNYGNYGIFLIMGHAGFCPSAVSWFWGPSCQSEKFRIVCLRNSFCCCSYEKTPGNIFLLNHILLRGSIGFSLRGLRNYAKLRLGRGAS